MKAIVKSILLILLLMAVSLPLSSYGQEMEDTTEVDLNYDLFVGENKIGVVLNTDDLKYKKKYPFEKFLYKAERVSKWKEESLKCFITKFNEQVCTSGLDAYDATCRMDSKYVISIVLQNVDSDGKVKGILIVTNTTANDIVASMPFKSHDGDDDDEVTFRDPMREIGESFGKKFQKGVKRAKKRIARQQEMGEKL